ncbi:hypothetical protein BJV78DRAFT_731427 [Lactifluus subvellereus]|nr:hypothetical protein BJV78DRAFT_731427 [Lactifluus subvellereus]
MTNVDVWFAFARDLGLGISRMDDIILVTGRHLARSSTNVAFFGHEGEREVSFRVRVPNSFGVEWQFSRQDIRGLAYNCGPSGSDLPQNQCIFIRGFRVRRRLRILPRLLGAAVPPGPGLGPGRDELISVSADTDNQDPVHIILDYLTTKAPDCDTALVHDDDLQYFVGASLENLQPDAVTGYLQTFMPNIERAQCDLFPVTRGGSGTEISVAKVASLSNYGLMYQRHSGTSRRSLMTEIVPDQTQP